MRPKTTQLKMSDSRRFPMLPWYPDDHLGSTRGWPLIADGILRRLLDAQWINGELPRDENALRLIAGATKSEWKRGWHYVEKKIPICEDGMRRNPRMERHRSKAIELSNKRNEVARRAAIKRWGGNSDGA